MKPVEVSLRNYQKEMGGLGRKNRGPVKWGEERRKSRAGGKKKRTNGRST